MKNCGLRHDYSEFFSGLNCSQIALSQFDAFACHWSFCAMFITSRNTKKYIEWKIRWSISIFHSHSPANLPPFSDSDPLRALKFLSKIEATLDFEMLDSLVFSQRSSWLYDVLVILHLFVIIPCFSIDYPSCIYVVTLKCRSAPRNFLRAEIITHKPTFSAINDRADQRDKPTIRSVAQWRLGSTIGVMSLFRR